MILKAKDYPGLLEDINLDMSDISFYYKKMKAVSENNVKNSESAKLIIKVIEENYPEYLI